MPLLTIARLTLFEATRRRLVLAVIILTIIIIALTGWGFSKLATAQTGSGAPLSHTEVISIAAGLVILVAYMFSFVLAIAAAFLAAPSIATDVESGLLLAILPRPIRRADVVVGRWLGLVILIGVYAAGAGALELLAVAVTTGYVPREPIVALLFLVAESITLLTLALLASTRLAPITGGIIAVVVFGIEWIIGIAAAIGTGLGNTALTNVGTIASLILPTDGLWRGAIYSLEPKLLIATMAGSGSAEARGNPFAVAAAPTMAYIIWAVAWIVVVVGAAVWSFSRRDL